MGFEPLYTGGAAASRVSRDPARRTQTFGKLAVQ
jgi:hypothetical protein